MRTSEVLSRWCQGANVLLLAASGLWYSVRIDALPPSIPVHWSATGPNRWGSKEELWLFLGAMALNVALTWLFAWVINRGKERDLSALDEDLGEAAREIIHAQKRLGVRMLESMFLLTNGGLAGMWWVAATAAETGDVNLVNRGVLGLLGLVVVAVVVPLAVGLRRGVRNQERLAELLPADAEDRWIAGGAIYYAPDDPRLWVAKRIGLGWTLNFARPASWWILLLLLGLPLGWVIALVVGGW